MLAGVIASAVATDFSLVQQKIVVDSLDYDYDYSEETGAFGKGGKRGGKGEAESVPSPTPASVAPDPTPAPTPVPETPAPTPATPAPTPPGASCGAYGTSAYTPAGGSQKPGQLPYAGMMACQSSTWANIHVASPFSNDVEPQWPGTCAGAMGTMSVKPWWSVQLAGTSIIESVELTNRKSSSWTYLQNVDIYVGGELCANTGLLGEAETKKFTCAKPLTGNEIMLKPPSNMIFVCGFAAYGRAA